MLFFVLYTELNYCKDPSLQDYCDKYRQAETYGSIVAIFGAIIFIFLSYLSSKKANKVTRKDIIERETEKVLKMEKDANFKQIKEQYK